MAEQELQKLIDACEKEPIHIPGGIQPFGALLTFTPGFEKLCHASANIADFLPVDAIWDSSPTEMLGAAVLQQLSATLANHHFAVAQTDTLNISAYTSAPYWVVELESIVHSKQDISVPAMLSRGFAELKRCQDKNSVLQTLTQQVRLITEFERVVLYQFDEEWQGRVMAESKGDLLGSLLGHHFPASDIPAQARAMYSRNPLRLIYSALAAPVPIERNPHCEAEQPVDMSSGILRAVSPLHMQYLNNLGVAASCSIGIFRNAKLWGLVGCHHTAEMVLTPERREVLRLLTEFAEERLFLLEADAVHNYQRRTHELRDALIKDSLNLDTPQQIIKTHGHHWLKLLHACGCAYSRDRDITLVGHAVSGKSLDQIIAWLNKHARRYSFWSTRHITQETGIELSGDDSSIAGLMAVPLSMHGESNSWLLFFRYEQVEVKNWAGKPEKEIYHSPQGQMLGPRTSFELWQQEVSRRSLEWKEAHLYAARDIARDLLIVADSIHLNLLNERLGELNEKLKHLAERDDLTGLWNRRVAEQNLIQAQQTAERYQRPYTVMLMDLDNFKAVNDKHGHNVGDEILIAVCEAVNQQIRQSDVFSRWGGEEFLLIAPETEIDDAKKLAERIRAAVADVEHPSVEQITISVGVAEYANEPTWDAVVERADRAMYKAKKHGRNRVETVPSST
ncbi:diguanylate cyclase [Aliidiomarina sp. Khilg15.8]